MINYFEEKQLKTPAIIIIIVIALGIICVTFFNIRNKNVKNDLDYKISVLNKYLIKKDIPSKQKLYELEKFKQHQEHQMSRILQEINSKSNFSDAYKDIESSLDMKELIANVKSQFKREDIGFSEYKVKVPPIEDLPVLKRQMALITKILTLADQNKINNINKIIRLKTKDISCLFVLNCKVTELVPFLYDISSCPEIILVNGIDIKSGDNGALDVLLKISYIEAV